MQYHINTYGCQMNYSDTERIETYLNQLGFTKSTNEEDANLIIFNSCSVKKKAEDKVLGKMKNLKKIKKQRPGLILALTGCMVRKSSTKKSERETQDKYIKKIEQLDIAFRIEDLPKLKSLIKQAAPKTKSLEKIQDELLEDYFHIKPSHASKAQVFIPISTGCDKFCTYCIVPRSRGRETSRHPDDILQEAKEAVEAGCLEITLLGQTVDSYGLSQIDRQRKLFDYTRIDSEQDPPPFVQLLQRIDELHKKGLKRLRFTSPHPKDVSPHLIKSYAELETLMPHIHLPVQSGDNNCLQRMNRPYTRERYMEIVHGLRKARPDIAITTDMIVGFCDESKEEYANTVDLYKEADFDFCYISRYSTRKGTFADKNLDDNITNEEKAKRWHQLNDLMREITQKKLEQYVGKTLEVLVEEFEPAADPTNSIYRGKCKHLKTVQFESSETNLKGTLQKIRIDRAESWMLFGEIA
ncbi:tRNA (N6-isopentenyl adenosine(37)-C2)-methylthiotransferase MiaB [Candidatus Peregrinibacteria bacterium]|jgi:tRNA-2-methylthio-N6-dimethylallyladenosine synthase|nr:tRNA (N6-isopentenyl adenosine(37)-C2)-methylthiotransferase MiaB [Candidatus Peregrinibacteria bacterium]MBT4148656.1 tRNA (N6-isopentenyl adenosine(37)-C2)-methylthiotransferase MiaB [Candidatus Peregrinibacteria bacterium]MBT4366338.1 tRNA (N6-isopentenyl adenosine(37)-C2)-methylthiotransferase MiaB [Candidatus Peregrinibacteria bacterium]MBT4456013.1 tRNA (N6-isopentenyl adenosine(37)-C2)-methylthiotransferase MiaB [Candidatus Peregrinibacteria bacterium]